jgi:hypothetical protein
MGWISELTGNGSFVHPQVMSMESHVGMILMGRPKNLHSVTPTFLAFWINITSLVFRPLRKDITLSKLSE